MPGALILTTPSVLAATDPLTAAAAAAKPPIAEQRPHVVESPNGNRNDEYYWLRDDTRTDPGVLAYLKAENAYTDAVMAPAAALQKRVYDETVARLKQDDASVPYRKSGWWYYSRFETGSEHPVYARKAGSLDAPEQVMLDVNALAEGKSYYQVDNWEVSPDGKLLAYAEDAVGRRQYRVVIKDIASGRVLSDTIANADAYLAWAADSRTLLWIEKDPETLLGKRIRKHVVGRDASQDPVVYEEADDSFFIALTTTKDDRYVLIQSSSTVSDEVRYADAADPALAFRVFLPRERGHEYSVERLGDRWIVRTNWKAKNFRVVSVPAGAEGDRSRWKDVIAHRVDALVISFDVFDEVLAVEERSDALRRVRLHRWADGADQFIASDEAAYTMRLGTNEEIGATTLRYLYNSLTTPASTYDLELKTGERVLKKREPVLGDFDPANYVTELAWATARDGQKVPVSIVHRKGVKRDGTAPLLQYGYGSYGYSIDPEFSIGRLSLLDRGMVFAIAHIRGGEERGRAWYEGGRLLTKRNTFNDFIDVTRFLVKERYADPKRVFAMGGSAGGLLMGAIINDAPQEYRGIVAQVPFVDVVTTMLDESIPLTTNEFDEWGNPKQKAYYDYLLSYAPYDNVRAQDYPAMFVGTGLWDSQVQYFEPAKWVARLRRLKTDANPLVFRVQMEAGHGGVSGRFQKYKEQSEYFAFVLMLAGITQ